MIKIPEFIDKIVEFPKRFLLRNNEDGTVTLESSPGEVAEAGTPISAANMNTLRDGIFQAAPVSAVMHFARTTAPEGWLACNGAAVSRTTYADLFSVIGTTFGSGDGSSTFNLPDLRDEFIRGWGAGGGLFPTRALGNKQAATIFTADLGGARYVDGGEYVGSQLRPGGGSYQQATNDRIAVRPQNIALLACIKY